MGNGRKSYHDGSYLTSKQRKFCSYYCRGIEKGEAAKLAGYPFPKIQANENLRKPYIQEHIKMVLNKAGLTAEAVAKAVKEGFTATTFVNDNFNKELKEIPDFGTRAKYIDIACKIRGDYNISVDVNTTFNAEELKRRAEVVKQYLIEANTAVDAEFVVSDNNIEENAESNG